MSNVVILKANHVYDDLQTYFNQLKMRSKNTERTYRRAIQNFFEWKYSIDLKQLHPTHINQITYKDLLNYQSELNKQKVAPSTINNTMAAIQSMFRELRRINKEAYPLDLTDLKVDPLPVYKQKHTEDITWEEVDLMIEYVKSLPERQNPKTKAALLETARRVPLRKEALLSLTFGDIKKISDNVYMIQAKDKGKWREIPISKELADLLFSLRASTSPMEKVFKGISSKTADRLINSLKQALKCLYKRDISFHSFKRLAGQELYDMTNDIELVRDFLGHSNIATTQIYMKKRELANHPSIHMGKKMNIDLVKDLEKEEWQEIFMKLSRSAQYEILRQIQS